MSNMDTEFVRAMCKQFNLHLEEIDEGGGYIVFDIEGLVQVMPPCEDTGGKWALFKVTVTPGCWTMPNGDPGYPDETDVDHLSDHANCLQAVVEGVKLVVETRAFDIDLDQAMYEESKEESRLHEQSFG